MFRKFRFRFLLIATLAFLWWLLSREDQEQAQSSREVEIIVPAEDPEAEHIPSKPAETPVKKPKAAPKASPETTVAKKPDDLKRISGIGPKIANVLQAAEITTYEKLAETEIAELKHILSEAGISIANPESWPEQARRAASGEI
jgi:predicted flap endonuclease-1-like 5' DNA nuclease